MIEYRPLGVACNISCMYCYQNPLRDIAHGRQSYSVQSAIDYSNSKNEELALFGGEPLLLPIEDLEKLFEYSYEKFGIARIQTNALLITEKHYELFHKFNVRVGISIDGPGDLNLPRWSRNKASTRKATAEVQSHIEKLSSEGRPPSIIVTLHRANAAFDHLQELENWFRALDKIGITSVRLHLMEVETAEVREALSLSTEENIRALKRLFRLENELANISFDVFREIHSMLEGDLSAGSCVWRGCDPLATQAVSGLEGNGQLSNCSRTNKAGVEFVKTDRSSHERSLTLYHTEQSSGGCRGCRFFLMCRGQCPGTAIDNDWRNRSEHCEVWKAIFKLIELDIIKSNGKPLSLSKEREKIETQLIRQWAVSLTEESADIMSL